jgi:hypothetical protein
MVCCFRRGCVTCSVGCHLSSFPYHHITNKIGVCMCLILIAFDFLLLKLIAVLVALLLLVLCSVLQKRLCHCHSHFLVSGISYQLYYQHNMGFDAYSLQYLILFPVTESKITSCITYTSVMEHAFEHWYYFKSKTDSKINTCLP